MSKPVAEERILSPKPIAVYSVSSPILWPIAAAEGDLLVIWPGHPTHTLTVCANRPGQPVIRRCHFPDGALYGVIMNLDLDEIIVPWTASDRAALRSSKFQRCMRRKTVRRRTQDGLVNQLWRARL